MSEKELTKMLIEYLNLKYPVRVWRQNTGKMIAEHKGKTRMVSFGIPGQADITGIHNESGKRIEIEVKLPKRKNRLTPAQREFLESVRRSGGIAFVATSIDDIDNELGGSND